MSKSNRNYITCFFKLFISLLVVFSNFTNKHQVSANCELEQPDLIFEERQIYEFFRD